MKIEDRLRALGFARTGTGVGCEAAERSLGDPYYLLITDGEAGYPLDDAPLWVGIFSQENGEPLFWKVDVQAEDLEVAIAALEEEFGRWRRQEPAPEATQ